MFFRYFPRSSDFSVPMRSQIFKHVINFSFFNTHSIHQKLCTAWSIFSIQNKKILHHYFTIPYQEFSLGVFSFYMTAKGIYTHRAWNLFCFSLSLRLNIISCNEGLVSISPFIHNRSVPFARILIAFLSYRTFWYSFANFQMWQTFCTKK